MTFFKLFTKKNTVTASAKADTRREMIRTPETALNFRMEWRLAEEWGQALTLEARRGNARNPA